MIPDEAPEERGLAAFAETFGKAAACLLACTGWVTYVVGQEFRIKHFLACSTGKAEQQDYETRFALLDPISPGSCLSDNRFVACLHEEISPRSAEHARYRADFMRRHQLIDALEVFLVSEVGIVVGCSLLRHVGHPEFSGEDMNKAHALKALGDLTLSKMFPGRLASLEMIATQFPALTPREAVIAQLVAVGLSNKQLSEELGISLATVKSHLLNIFRKLNVRSRAEWIARLLH